LSSKKRSAAGGQLQKFKEAARELGAEKSARQFDRTLKRVAKAKGAKKKRTNKKRLTTT
jgi:hypothetical protein